MSVLGGFTGDPEAGRPTERRSFGTGGRVRQVEAQPSIHLTGVSQTFQYFTEWISVLTVSKEHQYYLESLLRGAMQAEYFLEYSNAGVITTYEYPWESLQEVSTQEEYFLEWLLDVLAVSREHRYWLEFTQDIQASEVFPVAWVGHITKEHELYIEFGTLGFWIDASAVKAASMWTDEDEP